MAFLYDLETDIRFKQGKDIGEKKGIAEAEAKAKAKELKKNTDGVTKMLKTGRFTDKEIVEFLGVTIGFVKKIKKNLAKKKPKK